ncbi:hypothetical protein CPAR01_12295 [Colletotrichum paranaense]|uniref:Xylanolytic transcriptional activator regulatory domain-containing protein n=1 Tax=Colletotrichum paranaense TaxID=1914294 RepID=A0ABQ9S9L6_9PEZI|nr:uncharacterized protein CPAR01_12295 [Colletotrichum paranaense]KAK1529983.1 hypothetical protein CPAR01_12295 [Colletotrichum paranaense]
MPEAQAEMRPTMALPLTGNGEPGSQSGSPNSGVPRCHISKPACIESSDPDNTGNIEIPAALKALGYTDSNPFASIIPSSHSPSPVISKDFPLEIQEALRAVPPRPYTDILISVYFSHVNYHYEAIHQTTFVADYATWWGRRASKAMSDVALTSLVLQMCALGTQFVWPSTDQKLESELGESVDHLGMRMHEAAQRLSTFIPPGEGGLPLIQRLFLAGGWLKNRVEVTRSWHLICSAVREAQEIGLHIDSAAQEISTCEREVRRRMWYILNIWDTTFSGSFGRPRIIQEFGQVPPPNPRFELADSVSEETSAAAIIIREYRLWAFLSDPLSDGNSPHAKIQFVNDWIRGLPTVYSTIGSGAIGDGDLFANKFRRIKLHCMGYMALLAYLRRYLLSPPHPNCRDTEASSLREAAIQVAIHLMRISKEFFTLCHPIHSKYFLVQFCPFDTASTLCSALLRDTSRTWISHRLRAIQALGCALYILEKLKNLNRMGSATWTILTTMLAQVDLSADEQQMMNQSRRTGDIGGFIATFPAGEETTETNLLESFSPLESIEQLLVGDNFEIEATAQDAADLDLGLVGIGYNGSGIMALEEQINSNIFNTTWSWDNID